MQYQSIIFQKLKGVLDWPTRR